MNDSQKHFTMKNNKGFRLLNETKDDGNSSYASYQINSTNKSVNI